MSTNLSRSRLISLPASLPPAALVLDASENFLGDRQAEAGLRACAAALEWLDLSGNSLVQPALPPFPRLRYLSLAGNQLAAWPPLGGAPSLQCLALDDNRLAPSSPPLESPSLCALSLRNNLLAALPALSRDGLPSLWALDVDGNRLPDLGVLAALPGLMALSARANRIRVQAPAGAGGAPPPTPALPPGPLLETLRLDCNPLGLPAVAPLLRAYRRLQRLYAGFTGLRCVAGAGAPVPAEAGARLLVLDLTGCRLDDEGLGGLSALRALRALRLRGNNVTSSEALTAALSARCVPRLVELDLRDNPLTRGLYLAEGGGGGDASQLGGGALRVDASPLFRVLGGSEFAAQRGAARAIHGSAASFLGDASGRAPAGGDGRVHLFREALPDGSPPGCAGPETEATLEAAALELPRVRDVEGADGCGARAAVDRVVRYAPPPLLSPARVAHTPPPHRRKNRPPPRSRRTAR
jgi:Leucine-rich repeat (LRR) protein